MCAFDSFIDGLGEKRAAELLQDFHLVVETPVAWGDMDAFQHVNNVVFFRYFENARVVYGRKIGIDRRMKSDGIGPILAWTECKFIKPLVYPDTAIVGCRVLGVHGSELLMDYAVVSREQQAVAAVGRSLGVYYDYRNRTRVEIPEAMLNAIEELECKPVRGKFEV